MPLFPSLAQFLPKTSARITVTGQEAIARALDSLPPKLQKRALRRGVTKMARRIRGRARELVAVETGALKKALAFRVYRLKRGDGYGAVIGPVRDAPGKPPRYRRGVVRGKKGLRLARKGEQATSYRNPVNYAHLVELGHRSAPAKPFLRPALDQTRSEGPLILAAACRAQIARIQPAGGGR